LRLARDGPVRQRREMMRVFLPNYLRLAAALAVLATAWPDRKSVV